MLVMKGKPLFFASSLLLAPAWAFGASAALTQLQMAADAASNSVYAPTNEGAASVNQRWSENEAALVPAPSSSADPFAAEPSAPPQAVRPNLTAAPPAVPAVSPKDAPPDPLPPPNPKGWRGFYMSFLGVEGKSLSLLSATGKAAIPLLILLQPLVLPAALIGGLLGIFGVRL
jgi:hypothetical protein